jgi:hypothetical protein
VTAAADVRRSAGPLATVALALGTACDGAPASDGGCAEESCEVAATREELFAAIDGFADPMAVLLRERADDAGGLEGAFEEVLDGLGAATGCGPETERAFVVLSNQELLPKGIVTRCVDDPVAASAFFMVIEPDQAGTDLDPEHVRVAAWDPEAGAYHRYQMVARPESGGLGVAVEPAFCTSCHGGPFGVEAWTPIMNEMTNPWAQWNAEPGFASFQFDEAFPSGARGPVFDELTQDGRLDSASNLEPIVRAAIDRTANARLSVRDEAPDLEVALSLLRPVFCDESVNFVSEVHDAGELQTSALVDPGLRGAMLALADEAGWPWAWVTSPTIRIPPPTDGEPALALLAVRGETTVQAEAALSSRRVLEAEDVLRVRALDWTHPVFSELRCGLFRDAAERARAGSVDPAAHADNTSLVRALYDEAMVLPVAGELVPLRASSAGDIVAVADAQDPESAAALAAGDLSALEASPAELGAAVDAWVTQFEGGDARARLEAERRRRGCLARSGFVVTPLVPGLDECA